MIRDIFKTMNAIELDTPVLELRYVVDQMYGEEFNKSVYEVESDSETSNKLIMRYDLTVPLARYVAINGLAVLRRYQIGKVYRRDVAQLSKGRYREFIQCDFDIVGDDCGSGMSDMEILELMVRILDKLLGSSKYKIKLNHKEILTQVILKGGVEPLSLNTVCSTIDKLDKMSWVDLIPELIAKGLTTDQIDRVRQILEPKVTMDRLRLLVLDQIISQNLFDSVQKMWDMLESVGISDRFELDLTLARGMDYYTGIIYEAVYLDKDIMGSSVAAGGRYDKMIGKLSNKGDIPAIGLSIGVERIATIWEKTTPVNSGSNPFVYVASIGGSSKVFQARFKLCGQLRALGINCTMSDKQNPKMASQLETVFERKIPYMLVVGDREIDAGTANVKTIDTKEQKSMPVKDAIDFILDKYNNPI
jgi:histidyl-tRNA synthetase